MSEEDETHETQTHENDAEGELDNIDVIILFPALGAPCMVESGAGHYVEVLLATSDSARLSSGALSQYLRYVPFQATYDLGARDRATQIDAEKIWFTEQAWSLSDLKGGSATENAAHKGALDQPDVTLDQPICRVDTCRIHTRFHSAINDDYPKVYRVLIDASVFDVGTMYELTWLSEHNEQAFLQKLAENAGAQRGTKLTSAQYAELHQRHPFVVTQQAPTKFAHFTDIHNTTAHHVYNLSGCRVLENEPGQATPYPDRYAIPVGTRLNNYNRNFTYCVDKAKTMGAEALVLTGDIVDYARGLYWADGDKQRLFNQMEDATQDAVPAIIDSARSVLSQKELWDELGANDQTQYVWDANFKYFLEKKILPRYVADQLPVYTVLGNHDFHSNPFTPWPTTNGQPGEDSPNSSTPSDYNLTRYEAVLAYGPKTYEPYFSDTVKFMLFGSEGAAGLASLEECGLVYWFFINPFLDYAVRFGTSSLALFDFGREETRPASYMNPMFGYGLLAVAIGALLIAAAVAFFVWGVPALTALGPGGTAAAIAIGIILGILALAGLLAIILGVAAAASARRYGFGDTDYEALDDLPAAHAALSDEQQKLLDNWTALSGLDARAMFCHALVLGRAPKNMSIKLIRDSETDDPIASARNFKYGIITKGADKVLNYLKDEKITCTLSGHSHYSSVYQLSTDGQSVDAEFPYDGDATHSVPAVEGITTRTHTPVDTKRKRIVNVSPASGPMAELNLDQNDSLDNDRLNAQYLNRQLRDMPGGTLLELDSTGALIRRIVSDMPSNRPRRAAFDSWKKRFNDLTAAQPSPNDDDVLANFKYITDTWNPPGPPNSPPPHRAPVWPWQVDSLSFFSAGQQARFPFKIDDGDLVASATDEPPGTWATDRSDFTAYAYTVRLDTATFNRLNDTAGSGRASPAAIDYPSTDEDPWVFDVKVERVTTNSDRPTVRLKVSDLPDFDLRVSRYRYDQRSTPPAPAPAPSP